jgi:hypothetical protein
MPALSLREMLGRSKLDNANPWQKCWHAGNVRQKFFKIVGPIVLFNSERRVRISESRRAWIVRAATARIVAYRLSHD